MPDALAVAIDWLDAYRAADLETILDMYAEDGSIECRCGGNKIVSGKEAMRAYWVQRLRDYPALELDELHPVDADGARVAYVTPGGIVNAVLTVNGRGLISSFSCGPMH